MWSRVAGLAAVVLLGPEQASPSRLKAIPSLGLAVSWGKDARGRGIQGPRPSRLLSQQSCCQAAGGREGGREAAAAVLESGWGEARASRAVSCSGGGPQPEDFFWTCREWNSCLSCASRSFTQPGGEEGCWLGGLVHSPFAGGGDGRAVQPCTARFASRSTPGLLWSSGGSFSSLHVSLLTWKPRQCSLLGGVDLRVHEWKPPQVDTLLEPQGLVDTPSAPDHKVGLGSAPGLSGASHAVSCCPSLPLLSLCSVGTQLAPDDR